MFDTEVQALDADGLLSHVVAVRAVAQQAEVRVIEVAAAWADLHGVIERAADAGPVFPGSEQLVPFGGDGTREVAEFCTAELGAEMGTSPETAAMLIGDALDLRHRLPILWARVRAGEVKAWIGRRVATDTRGLSVEAVAVVDRQVGRYAHALTWGRLARVVQAAIIDADPDYARQREQARRRDRGVWLHPADETGTVFGSFAAAGPDAVRFDAGVDRLADALGLLGDTDCKQVRRARALGVLTNPQQTMDLFAQAAAAAAGRDACNLPADVTSSDGLADSDAHGATEPRPYPGETGPVQIVRGKSIRVDPRPKAILYVHLTDQTLHTETGVARVEGVGPVTADQAREWLGDCTVTVRPVLDLAGIAAVDCYEIPDRIREPVHLVSPADTFPYGSNTGRTMDLDHSVPYVSPDEGGPPGQTGVGKLGPMTRRHHRIKTHSGWQIRQPFPGILFWRSPHGRHYLVDHTGTHRLSPQTAA